jgi:hypothetical protein
MLGAKDSVNYLIADLCCINIGMSTLVLDFHPCFIDGESIGRYFRAMSLIGFPESSR